MLFEKLYETYNTVLHSISRHFEMSAVSFFFHFFGQGGYGFDSPGQTNTKVLK